ncbi:helix-turn-helix domain-containing protein [Polaribacter sp. M15]
MEKNLNKRITKTATSWKARAKKDRANRRNISRAQEFALELLDYMDLHNIKQIDLAKKMDVTPQQVNKILRAKSNITFETLDKIADALGVIISSPKIKVNARVHSKVLHNTMQIVHKKGIRKIEEDMSTARVVMKNPLLEKNLQAMNEYSYTSEKM